MNNVNIPVPVCTHNLPAMRLLVTAAAALTLETSLTTINIAPACATPRRVVSVSPLVEAQLTHQGALAQLLQIVLLWYQRCSL